MNDATSRVGGMATEAIGPASGSMTCVVDNGSILPPLAPPGGCGGAA